jgi:hypothetical protein
MTSPLDDRASDAFRVVLSEGGKGPGLKAEALEALALRPVWLATWEPRAEGYRTLINANGEEALAVFSSEAELQGAATRFGWLEADGTIATHRAIGGDILRHAWTREYAYVVIDIGSEHSLEYARDELKRILRDVDSTGPFRTSRPPAAPETPTASSSFPPPVERISTMYSMMPSYAEKIDRLSDLPTKPHEIPRDSEPPTKPRAALKESEPPPTQRESSRPASKPKSEPPGTRIEEVAVGSAKLGDGGTYGAASFIPRSQRRPKSISPSPVITQDDVRKTESHHPLSSAAPKLNSDAPTAPAAPALPSVEPGKIKLPAIGPIGPGPLEPNPMSKRAKEPIEKSEKPQKSDKPKTERPARIAAPSIGDGIKLVELRYAPDETLLQTLGDVLRGYFEIEWASYCEVARPAGEPSPAVGLRITDNYRDNVTVIIKDLCEASRRHDVEIDVLLIDGHDMLRKAREHGFVFYPWKPKAFGS